MMTRVTTDSGIELQVDSHTIERARARGWQVVVVTVCLLVGAALLAGWLVCCAVSGCSSEPDGALAYNIRHGIYGNEMCEFEEVGQ